MAESALELSESSDPEVAAYFQQWETFKNLPFWQKKEALELAHIIQNQTHYVALTLGVRQSKGETGFHHLREPDLDDGDNLHVIGKTNAACVQLYWINTIDGLVP